MYQDILQPILTSIFLSLILQIIQDDSKRSTTELMSPAETKYCLVQQVRGLDYTEATVILQAIAADDINFLTYTLSVGTEPGGNEVIQNQLFKGPTVLITEVFYL